MRIQIEKRLSAQPKPTPVPGNVTLRFDARSSREDAAVDVSYSIGESWNICFDGPGGPSKKISFQTTLSRQSRTVRKQARLVRCSGDDAALLRVTASVTEVSTGQTTRTACRIVPT